MVQGCSVASDPAYAFDDEYEFDSTSHEWVPFYFIFLGSVQGGPLLFCQVHGRLSGIRNTHIDSRNTLGTLGRLSPSFVVVLF